MTTVAEAAEYKTHLGYDFPLADAYDPEYLDTDAKPEEDETAARQELNLRMAEWYGIG
jgi:hypothetical protein